MTILPLVISPDPLLKMISIKIDQIDDSIIKLAKDMIDTMHSEGGVGLAAVQVGVLKRLVVMDIDYEDDDHDHSHNHGHNHDNCGGIHIKNPNPKYFINPEIIESSNQLTPYNEGCLSFPDARSQVVRPNKIKVRYLDLQGKQHIEEMEGLSCVCIQHEIDHLNGITFVDRISSLKREMILRKMKKLHKRDIRS